MLKVLKCSKFGPTCDVTGSRDTQNIPQKASNVNIFSSQRNEELNSIAQCRKVWPYQIPGF